MPYEVPPLPYDYDALEPHIDEQTMRLHHDKHHQAYVDNANKALAGTEWEDRPVENVLANLEILPEDNQDGGSQQRRRPREPLALLGDHEPRRRRRAERLPRRGDRRHVRQRRRAQEGRSSTDGVKRFGSGWSWLVYDGTALSVYSTANQDSPISNSDVPLLGIDVWEHAYYLKYQNRRPEYLETWWNVVNWDAVQKRYESADK